MSTAGYVKLLLPPRQSRGNSHWGLEPDLDSSPEKFRRSLEGDIARWTPIVNAIGLKLD